MTTNHKSANKQQIKINDAVKSALQGDYKTMVEKAEEIGKDLEKRGLSTSQIRNVFGSLKRMEMRLSDENFKIEKVALLKPRIAYAEKRHGKGKIHPIKEVIDAGVDEILKESDKEKRKEKFKHFCEFFEAILAYHRFFGGK